MLGYANDVFEPALTPGSKDEAHHRAIYLHNVGCVFFRMNRFALAAAHFCRALEAVEPWRTVDRWGGNIVTSSPLATEFVVKPPGRATVGAGISPGVVSPIYEVRAIIWRRLAGFVVELYRLCVSLSR